MIHSWFKKARAGAKVLKTHSSKRLLFVSYWILFFMATALQLHANHIVGGQITYRCVGYVKNDPTTNARAYKITLKVYRDCARGNPGFDSQSNQPTASVTIYGGTTIQSFLLDQPDTVGIRATSGSCLVAPPNICLQEATYTFDANLDIINKSYFVSYQRCCRNNTITNLIRPELVGATFTVEITPEAQLGCNSSPVFKNFPPSILCAGIPFSIDQAGTDADADSLAYAFCTPYTGGGSVNGICATCTSPDPDLPPPYNVVPFKGTFTQNFPLGQNANFKIDPKTGIISGIPQLQGQYVVGFCISEYRNGKLLSVVRRDFQFNVGSCQKTLDARIKTDSIAADGSFFVKSCTSTIIDLVNTSLGNDQIKTFKWEFNINGATQIFSTKDIKVDFAQPGNYTGQLILNPGTICTDTAALTIRISPTLKARFSAVYDSCATGAIQFKDLSSSQGGTLSRWSWTFGDAALSTQASPSHQYNLAGNYKAKLQVADVLGCTDTFARQINYFPIPVLLDIKPSITQGCTPLAVNFAAPFAAVYGSPPYKLSWNFGDGTSGSILNPSHTYVRAGSFTPSLSLTAPNGCSRVAVGATPIVVSGSPQAKFIYAPQTITSQKPEVTFTDQSVDAQKWSWNFGGTGTSTDQNPLYTFPQVGKIKIKLQVTNAVGCIDTITQEINIQSIVAFYIPNVFSPNDDNINDEFRGLGPILGISNFKMAIYDRWGNLIYLTENSTASWNGKQGNSGSDAVEGVYLYKISFIKQDGQSEFLQGTVTLVR
jgi:gliding motility-associated-like protein